MRLSQLGIFAEDNAVLCQDQERFERLWSLGSWSYGRFLAKIKPRALQKQTLEI